MAFSFATANQILFGSGTVHQVGAHARRYGQRALVVTGRDAERAQSVLQSLEASDIATTLLAVNGEPEIDLIAEGAAQARSMASDVVVAIGGGSAIDAAKAIAAMQTNPGPVRDYLEVVGKAQPLSHPPTPCIAVPTTAGTGSEVTRNAVLRCPVQRVKVSMRSPLMLPKLALVDPDLTLSLPPAVTAATGFDALAQLLEAFVSRKANPLTDAFCREGLRLGAGALQRAYHSGDDRTARRDMALASLYGGLALANAGLGAVHGIAGPLGGMCNAPHGAVCARLLPLVVQANVNALQTSQPDAPHLGRYREVARILTGVPTANAADGIVWLRRMVQALQIPSLDQWGLKYKDVEPLAHQAQRASSMRGNPIPLKADTLVNIITNAMEPEA